MATKKCKDHLGHEFSSVTEMCEYWNVPRSTFFNRMTLHRDNYTLEQALTLPPDNHRNAGDKCVDHLGNKFNSKKAMCEHWGIDRALYHSRIRLGWSLKDALTKPLDYKGGAQSVTDHLGNTYTDIGAMCKCYNIGRTTYNQRIKAGWSVKDALTKQVKYIRIERKACTDHLGNTFSSQNAMCKHYGITKDLLRSRLDLGWTLESILENPTVIDPKKEQTDHLGNKFESVQDMLKYWNVNETTFRERIRRGLSLKNALLPDGYNFKKCVDHLGNKFNSINDMCRYWNVPLYLYHSRINTLHWSLDKALTTIVKNSKIDDKLTVVKLIENPYYEVIYENNHEIWFDYEILEYYRRINNIMEVNYD